MLPHDNWRPEFERVKALILEGYPVYEQSFARTPWLLEFLFSFAFMAGEIEGMKQPCVFWCHAERMAELAPAPADADGRA